MRAFDSSKGARWRAASSRLAVQVRWVASVPLRQWPLEWHAAAAIVVATLCAMAAGSWEQLQARRQAQAASDLPRLRAELENLRRPWQAHGVEPTPVLADDARADRVLHDLGALGSEGAMKITSVKVEHGEGRQGVIRQVRFIAKVHGEYPGVKSWIAQLLDRHSPLALSSMTLRRVNGHGNDLEATVVFLLFVKVTL